MFIHIHTHPPTYIPSPPMKTDTIPHTEVACQGKKKKKAALQYNLYARACVTHRY